MTNKNRLRDEIMADILNEGFVIVHSGSGKIISLGNDKQWEVREYNQCQGKEYQLLTNAMKEAEK